MTIPRQAIPLTCGQPTTKDQACTLERKRASYNPMSRPGDWSEEPLRWQLGGCHNHLTEADQAVLYLLDQIQEQRHRGKTIAEQWMAMRADLNMAEVVIDDLRRKRQETEPACWLWYLRRPALQPTATIDELRTWHDGDCAICGQALPLVADHDHWSGFVRGFLCRDCNRGEGGHYAAQGVYAGYRQWHPAKRYGVLIPHQGVKGEVKWAGGSVEPTPYTGPAPIPAVITAALTG